MRCPGSGHAVPLSIADLYLHCLSPSRVHWCHSLSILALSIVDGCPPSTPMLHVHPVLLRKSTCKNRTHLVSVELRAICGRVTVSQPADYWQMLTNCGSVNQQGGVQTPGPSQTLSIALVFEGASTVRT